ncbi:MAG: helix-turn-helix domain-containing protein [Oscillospiraceae bacterium]|nr:helix-turn-helix domain-containing protein [Oscillospiraceae bacterium]
MLLEELAKDMVEVTSTLVGGRTINIMNTSGVIIASSEHERIGSFHQGAWEAIRTGKVVNIKKDQLDRYPGAKEGCNMPLRVNGTIIGVVGIYGDPEEIRDIAHLLEVYAAKYYQLEAMLRPRLSESTLRSQLLLSLLSPPNGILAAAHSLVENLNIHFQFPIYTVVISSPWGLSQIEKGQKLSQKLEMLNFLKKQHDVWGIVDGRMVLLCSTLEGRDVASLHALTDDSYRVSLGMPSGSLWEIQHAYDQASILDLSSAGSFSDIRHLDTRCSYMLSRTAVQEEAFLKELYQKLLDAFAPDDCALLLESAKAYYDCGRSVSTAAQQQFVHKNTLQYRVKRLLEVLELGRLSAFRQEYLVRLVIEYHYRKSRSQDLEK